MHFKCVGSLIKCIISTFTKHYKDVNNLLLYIAL